MNIVRLIYKNLWRDGTISTGYYSSQEPQFPAIDTQQDTLDQQWRTTNDTDDPIYITNNLGAACKYDFVALLGHNIPNTATIKIRGADDAAITVNVVEDTITWNATNIYFYLAAVRTKQYVQIQITTPGNPDDYITIATIVVAKFFEPNCNIDWDYSEGDSDPSVLGYSDAMVLHAQEKEEMFEGKYFFGSLNDVAIASVEELITLCGERKAFVLCFDYDNPNTTSHWVRLSGISQPRAEFINVSTWRMSVVEVK